MILTCNDNDLNANNLELLDSNDGIIAKSHMVILNTIQNDQIKELEF